MIPRGIDQPWHCGVIADFAKSGGNGLHDDRVGIGGRRLERSQRRCAKQAERFCGLGANAGGRIGFEQSIQQCCEFRDAGGSSDDRHGEPPNLPLRVI